MRVKKDGFDWNITEKNAQNGYAVMGSDIVY
jgi:hypothetical protein